MPKRTVKGSGKKSPLNMRTTQVLREKLEKAAGVSGRSLVQEVEFRLEQSFDREDFGKLHKLHVSTLMWQVYECCVLIEAYTGKNCFADDAKSLRVALAELAAPTPLEMNNHDPAYLLGRAVAEAVAGRRAMGDLFRLSENNL
jgi:TraY domain